MTETECDYMMVVAYRPRWHLRHFWRLKGCGQVDEFAGKHTPSKARADAQRYAEKAKCAIVLFNLTDETVEQINNSNGRIKIGNVSLEKIKDERREEDL